MKVTQSVASVMTSFSAVLHRPAHALQQHQAQSSPCLLHHRLRWRLPWGVRLRAAQLLLAAVLAARASGKEGAPLADGPELEQLLAERLWPALGISGAVQDALQPFLLFQAYCASGALRVWTLPALALAQPCAELLQAS